MREGRAARLQRLVGPRFEDGGAEGVGVDGLDGGDVAPGGEGSELEPGGVALGTERVHLLRVLLVEDAADDLRTGEADALVEVGDHGGEAVTGGGRLVHRVVGEPGEGVGDHRVDVLGGEDALLDHVHDELVELLDAYRDARARGRIVLPDGAVVEVGRLRLLAALPDAHGAAAGPAPEPGGKQAALAHAELVGAVPVAVLASAVAEGALGLDPRERLVIDRRLVGVAGDDLLVVEDVAAIGRAAEDVLDVLATPAGAELAVDVGARRRGDALAGEPLGDAQVPVQALVVLAKDALHHLERRTRLLGDDEAQSTGGPRSGPSGRRSRSRRPARKCHHARGGDCDDASAQTHPAAAELCDGLDNDCTRGTTETGASIGPVVTATIQEAIDLAAPGDTVLVCRGTFDEDLVIEQDLTLLAPSGPELTVILGSTRSLSAISVLEAIVTIEGFTVTGPYSAITAEGSDRLTVQSCLLTDSGNGLSATAGTVEMIDTTVENNDDGGVVVRVSRGLSLTRTVITNNTGGDGGGIALYPDADVTLTADADSSIDRNEASSQGGGVYIGSGSYVVTVTGLTLDNNNATGDGGGLYADSEIVLVDTTVTNNEAGDDGGGVYLPFGGTLRGVTVSDNDASSIGGGVAIAACTAEADSTTLISGNTAYEGGGVYVVDGQWTGGVIDSNLAH